MRAKGENLRKSHIRGGTRWLKGRNLSGSLRVLLNHISSSVVRETIDGDGASKLSW